MTGRPPHRAPVGHVVATTGAALVMAGSFLPWIRSGEVLRNSYAMLRVADDLGVVHGWPRRTILVAWFAMPAATGALVLLTLSRRRVLHAALSAAIAVLALLVWWAAVKSPLSLTYGATVNLAGVTLLLLGALLSNRPRRSHDV